MSAASNAGLAESIDQFFKPFSDAVNAIVFYSVPIAGVDLPIVVIWLMLAALVLTIALGFINIRGFGHGFSLITGGKKRDGAGGEITHFEALSSALSGTVGLGNIASVPVAIALGGPGAVFWMILAGFLGMSSKFAECALAVKYRRINADDTVNGGPMYYIEDVFRRRGLGPVGKFAAVFFAIMTIGASVSVFQVNQSYEQFELVTKIEAPLIYGAIISGLVAIVILGGIKKIARVTRILVPAMGILYLSAAAVIILLYVGVIPGVIVDIYRSAFGLEAAGGGMVGALINGMKRATYSSEAGVGSAAIAHAAVKTDEPVTEGYVALLEPFIDTIVVCTVTALVILVTGAHEPFLYSTGPLSGISMTSAAFEGTFSWYPVVLLVSVVLFAFSTLVTWAHYGAQAAGYLFGSSRAVDVTFKLLLCLALSTGAAIQLGSIINFIDSMLFAMAVPNIIALYLLLPELRRDVKAYNAKYLA